MKKTRNPKCDPPRHGRSLPNFSKYLVTESGQVYSLICGRYLRATCQSKGYPQVWLVSDKGTTHWHRVHRMVAILYVDNPRNLPIVHHKDNNRKNAQANNLVWVSQRENIRLAAKAGRLVRPKGEAHHNYGKKFSEETRRRMSESKRGQLSHRFKARRVAPAERVFRRNLA